MLKYKNIIGQLSISQKIHMICDIKALSEKEYRALGIPEVKIGRLDESTDNRFPSPCALANSWNSALVGDVAKALAKDMAAKDINIVATPGAKIKISPYSAALSEDVTLAAELAGEYLSAVTQKGMSACIKNFSFTPDDVEWMDEAPNGRVIYEYMVKPYKLAAEKGKLGGINISSDLFNKNYARVNSALTKIVCDDESFTGSAPICEKADMTDTVSCIANGAICFEGVSLAVESALNKYNQMKNAIANGNISEQELQEEIAKGHVISPETIDEAADRLIDFAFANKREKILVDPTGESEKELALKAAKESIVLLKNNKKILPANKKLKLCILGDIAMAEGAEQLADDFSALLSAKGYKIVGKERGYDLLSDRSEDLLAPAIELAKQADTVLLFLGLDKKREKRIYRSHKLSLPANQQILLDRLGAEGKKIIAIVSSDCSADIVIDEKTEAVIFAPLNTSSSAEALASVISGEYSPCGKLANSVYIGSDTHLKKQAVYKQRDGLKAGPFIGYRYYDTAEYHPGYVFGHGLSYTEFVYSKLIIKDGMVNFTVKNSGKMKASEVAQIYVGIEDSAVIRPKKELMAFAKIELAPGEKQTLQIPLKLPEIFEAQSKSFVAEKGTYTVYIASSVKDVKLSCSVKAGEKTIAPDGEIKSKYLQSESNIISDNYKLEANCDIMRKSVLNIIAGVTSLLLAVILKSYCVLSNTDAIFFDILTAILAVAGWVFFVTEALARKKERKKEKANIEEANKQAFEDAEQVPISDAEQLFVKEFDIAEEEETSVTVSEDYSEEIGAENFIYINDEQNFENASNDFITAAAEKGYRFEPSSVRKIFASIASSRIVIANGMSAKTFQAFMLLLGNYFETPVYIDSVDESYTNCESLFFKNDAQGNRTKTNMMLALESAQKTTHKIHFAGITNVKLGELNSYFSPIVKHANNPYVRNTYQLPQNLWVVVNIAEGESLGALPANIAEIATVNNFTFKECAAVQNHTAIPLFSYYQMEFLAEKIVSKLEIDEDTWKKVDKLEAYVNSHSQYHIGNKLWLCLEKYAAVFTACGAEQNEAIDESIAAKIIPTMIIALDGKLSKDDTRFSETVEAIFGEDNISACKKVIKTCGADIM